MIYQTTLMMAPIMITIIIVLIIFWIIAIGLALWVYKDAKKRDMNAAVWLLIVLVTGCIGCIIYVIVRD
ncbi:hypothetical protein LCGC14_0860950 [marine sediment metagenome]|uniref:Cardiolipin synthase N-terminal domain-containing protein n=1 Tax=marine sediment metagenome TaxID=412755 RepID=A0A0F9RS51_9ZZZZ|nr:hypothetical protein [bacterium]